MLIIEKKPVELKNPKDDDPEFWHLICVCQRGNEKQFSVCGTLLKGIFPTKKIPPEDFCAMCASVTECPVCKMPRRFKG